MKERRKERFAVGSRVTVLIDNVWFRGTIRAYGTSEGHRHVCVELLGGDQIITSACALMDEDYWNMGLGAE